MRQIVIILMMLLSAGYASGQQRGGHQARQGRQEHQSRSGRQAQPGRERRQDSHPREYRLPGGGPEQRVHGQGGHSAVRGGHREGSRQVQGARHGSAPAASRGHIEPRQRPGHGHGVHHQPIICSGDFQELWNGCHVRRSLDYIYVYRRNGDRLIWGHEVILLPSGYYKVRMNNIWRIYDALGNQLRVWSWDFVDQLSNGFFISMLNGSYYISNLAGELLNGVWGDEVILMDNGLFRCLRNGRYYYYDEFGNLRM